MRELRFRAYHHTSGMKEFVLSDIGQDRPGHLTFNDGDIHPLGELQVTEWSYLYDKNGARIYEGDIVRHNANDFVIVNSQNLGLVGVAINENLGDLLERLLVTTKHNNRDRLWFVRVQGYVTVIGNIYENPEFIKEVS